MSEGTFNVLQGSEASGVDGQPPSIVNGEEGEGNVRSFQIYIEGGHIIK